MPVNVVMSGAFVIPPRYLHVLHKAHIYLLSHTAKLGGRISKKGLIHSLSQQMPAVSSFFWVFFVFLVK